MIESDLDLAISLIEKGLSSLIHDLSDYEGYKTLKSKVESDTLTRLDCLHFKIPNLLTNFLLKEGEIEMHDYNDVFLRM